MMLVLEINFMDKNGKNGVRWQITSCGFRELSTI